MSEDVSKILIRVNRILEKADEIHDKCSSIFEQLEVIAKSLDGANSRDIYRELGKLENVSEMWNEHGTELVSLVNSIYEQNGRMMNMLQDSVEMIKKDLSIVNTGIPRITDMLNEMTDRDNKGEKIPWYILLYKKVLGSVMQKVAFVLLMALIWLIYHLTFHKPAEIAQKVIDKLPAKTQIQD